MEARRQRWILIIACYSLLLSSKASAFGDKGHEIIAAMAYSQLTLKTKMHVDRLLATDKDTLTESDFNSRATWADKYRDSDRNTSKVRYSATHNWHFVNLDLEHPNLDAVCTFRKYSSSTKLASKGNEKDCIVDKLEQFIGELKNPAIQQSEKILALKFILHFVGDLHQPLHAADHNDRGGNQLTLSFTKEETRRTNITNLHGYWDHHVIDDLGEKTSVTVARLNLEISHLDKKSWQQGNVRDWAMESNRLAKESVYNFKGLKQFKDKDDHLAYVLNAHYQVRATELIAIQIKKASVRLAAILNDAFDPMSTID